jgi:hypothetical protein
MAEQVNQADSGDGIFTAFFFPPELKLISAALCSKHDH